MLSFMTATAEQQRDATAWLASLPRHLRKQYRPNIGNRTTDARRNKASHDGVDSYMKTEFRIDHYHTQNLEFLDRAYDFDEFGDIDNEFDGLTIHEPDSEAALLAFCTGYDTI